MEKKSWKEIFWVSWNHEDEATIGRAISLVKPKVDMGLPAMAVGGPKKEERLAP